MTNNEYIAKLVKEWGMTIDEAVADLQAQNLYYYSQGHDREEIYCILGI
jgi:hypothetical protein